MVNSAHGWFPYYLNATVFSRCVLPVWVERCDTAANGLALLLETCEINEPLLTSVMSAYGCGIAGGGSALDKQLRWIFDLPPPPPARVPRSVQVYAAAAAAAATGAPTAPDTDSGVSMDLSSISSSDHDCNTSTTRRLTLYVMYLHGTLARH